MALTFRTLAALTLTLAGSAGVASAQAPIFPGDHGGTSFGPRGRVGATVQCTPSGCDVGVRADLSFGRRRGRAHHRTSRIQPVRRRSTCSPRRVHARRVWVPGHYEQVFHAAEYEYVTDPCGRVRRVLVQAAHYDDVWVPGRYETRRY